MCITHKGIPCPNLEVSCNSYPVCEGNMAVNAPESAASGGAYSHITKATCAITSHMIGPHDVAMNMA